MADARGNDTLLLAVWRLSRKNAPARLIPLVQSEFRSLAGPYGCCERSDRAQFLVIAAVMRRLMDHARCQGAEVLAVDEALARLRQPDPQKAQVVGLRYFAGLRVKEPTGTLEILDRMMKCERVVAKAWLRSPRTSAEAT